MVSGKIKSVQTLNLIKNIHTIAENLSKNSEARVKTTILDIQCFYIVFEINKLSLSILAGLGSLRVPNRSRFNAQPEAVWLLSARATCRAVRGIQAP